MPEAARPTDITQHGPPLTGGPGSVNVLIGMLPAWRSLPAGVASAVESVSNSAKQFMKSPILTPADAGPKIAKITAGLGKAAGKAAVEGNPVAVGASASAAATLNAANAALSATWTAAAAVPGGQPAANIAYTEGIKGAMAAASGAVFTAIGGMTDTHICPIPCPIPPHGPGVVTKGSKSVVINNLPAARRGDKVFEACGGADPIAMGCPTVLIGEEPGSGGAASDGNASDSTTSASAGEAADSDPHAAEAELTYAGIEPDPEQPGESLQEVGTGTHWLEIELVNEAEEPVVGERYDIHLPDDHELTGALDARGQVRINGIEKPGWCRIKFPNLDLTAWQRWAPASGTVTEVTGPSPPPPPAELASGPVAGGNGKTKSGEWRHVRQGECISSVAKDTGHFRDTLWDHPANAELKRRRGQPNVLLPGDAIFVPDRREREESGSTDQHHRFRRRGEPEILRIRLLNDDDQPWVGQKYTFKIDDKEYPGVTNRQGMAEAPIRGNARGARLILHLEDVDGDVVEQEEADGNEGAYMDIEYDLRLGFVDPINELSGVQARLNNLDYHAGSETGEMTPQTEQALRQFQYAYGLKDTGRVDGPTREKLMEIHGS